MNRATAKRGQAKPWAASTVLVAGSGWLLEGLGRFGGAGATIKWPAP